MTRLKGPESPGVRIALAVGAVIIIAGGAWFFSSGRVPEEEIVTQPPARRTRTIPTSPAVQTDSPTMTATIAEPTEKASNNTTTSTDDKDQKADLKPEENSDAEQNSNTATRIAGERSDERSSGGTATTGATERNNAPLPANAPMLAPAPPAQDYNQPQPSLAPAQPNLPSTPHQPIQPTQPTETAPSMQPSSEETRQRAQARPRTSTGGGIFKPYQGPSPVISDEE